MFTSFRPRIRSRHPSHAPLRNKDSLPLLPYKSVIRLGSTTEMKDTVSNGGNRIEINTIESVRNSASKLRMKNCFKDFEVQSPEFWEKEDLLNMTYEEIRNLPYPLIGKRVFGSRGRGIELIENTSNLSESLLNCDYLYEKYYNYNREYRLHVTRFGCFYTCRKMLKSDAPDEQRFFRNDSNCVWIVEDNPKFNKPDNWDTIVEHCVLALKSTGLDVGACDVRVQGKEESPKFQIIEINSAPSFGEITLEKYKNILPRLINEKYHDYTRDDFNEEKES